MVTGNEEEKVHAALHSLDVTFVHNPNFAEGLSTSLKIGLTTVSPEADGALICLGDMPLIEMQTINQLISSFNEVSSITQFAFRFTMAIAEIRYCGVGSISSRIGKH